ncbi:MAG: hypothetical protein HYS13_14325 [Planctomycetia bacterium]|nr:hypothetical protein [Planctomycetia bacterium]
MARRLLLCLFLLPCGCTLLPEIAHEPQVRNPFPQLSKVAIAPFFNLTTNPFASGREFALAYYGELQRVPGYEVVPIGVTERAIEEYQLSLGSVDDVRKLAAVLGADAVVVGAITDFDPYSPPRCALKVEWYAANPSFHPIPPGYGLPLGTVEQEQMPELLVYEAQLAKARSELSAESPPYEPPAVPMPPALLPEPAQEDVRQLAHRLRQPLAAPAQQLQELPAPQTIAPTAGPTECRLPVMQHVAAFHGHDGNFVRALQSYVSFRDDPRHGDWKAYLQRSDDFIRFCCYLHIQQMLSARGGAAETRVVWRWPVSR